MYISSNEGFQDQSSFSQVREALWHWPQSRASVLVGSGFSRNALKRWPGVEEDEGSGENGEESNL
jgi:hypothetical protein